MSDATDEEARLRALQETGLLDSAPDSRFDRFTRLASAVTGAPITLISLIDANRQWFKSCIGLGAKETPREYAFCDHAIRQTGLFVIPDATADARFADNPLVTGEPHIRFYAGAPLILSNGFAIGTLCVIDTVPRHDLSDAQRESLIDLAHLVVREVEADGEAKNRETAISELQHRISNMFGQMAGLMALSVSGEQTREQYINDLRSRVDSLNELNRQLAKRDWVAGDLRELILAAILPIIGGHKDRLELSGAHMDVSARAAMSISLALSELAVNSLKHGALGGETGNISLTWTHVGDLFSLTWREAADRVAPPPAGRKGFGSSLLTRIVPRDLGGEASLVIEDRHLTYNLRAPVASLI